MAPGALLACCSCADIHHAATGSDQGTDRTRDTLHTHSADSLVSLIAAEHHLALALDHLLLADWERESARAMDVATQRTAVAKFTERCTQEGGTPAERSVCPIELLSEKVVTLKLAAGDARREAPVIDRSAGSASLASTRSSASSQDSGSRPWLFYGGACMRSATVQARRQCPSCCTVVDIHSNDKVPFDLGIASEVADRFLLIWLIVSY